MCVSLTIPIWKHFGPKKQAFRFLTARSYVTNTPTIASPCCNIQGNTKILKLLHGGFRAGSRVGNPIE